MNTSKLLACCLFVSVVGGPAFADNYHPNFPVPNSNNSSINDCRDPHDPECEPVVEKPRKVVNNYNGPMDDDGYHPIFPTPKVKSINDCRDPHDPECESLTEEPRKVVNNYNGPMDEDGYHPIFPTPKTKSNNDCRDPHDPDCEPIKEDPKAPVEKTYLVSEAGWYKKLCNGVCSSDPAEKIEAIVTEILTKACPSDFAAIEANNYMSFVSNDDVASVVINLASRNDAGVRFSVEMVLGDAWDRSSVESYDFISYGKSACK